MLCNFPHLLSFTKWVVLVIFGYAPLVGIANGPLTKLCNYDGIDGIWV
jgi:hypothetical protein